MSEMIDFKKMRETASTVLTGDYAVVVDKAEFKRTQKANEPMWVLTLKVTSGPYAGRTVRHNLVLSSTHNFMVNRFFRHMEALGLDEAFLDNVTSPDAVCAAVMGKHVIATLKEGGEFRGEKQSEVEELKPATGGVSISLGEGVAVASSLPSVAAMTPSVAEGIAPPEDPF